MSFSPKPTLFLSAEEKRALLERLLREKARQPQMFPLSFAQERLWFLDRLQPGLAVYNLLSVLPLVGPLNVAALEQSLNEVVRRHETLRTSFHVMDGQPQQVVAPAVTVPLALVDLQSMPETTRGAEAERLAMREVQHVFDLTQAPLLQALLVRLHDAQHVLILTLHHIVADGWSLSVLQRELAVCYDTYAAGRASPLPELPIQYAEFAQWQRHWLQGEVLETQLAYWKAQLEGAPAVLELPLDHPRPAVQTFRGAWQGFTVVSDVLKQLHRVSQQYGVTLFMTLLAAFQTLLYRYTGQTDLMIGTSIANRNRGELEELIGCFVNTLVLRTDLSGNPCFSELLGRVRDVTLGAYTHQELPFEKLVETLQPQRSLSYAPLFQVLFSLQNAPMVRQPASPPPQAPAAPSTGLPQVALGTSKFDLSLFMEETAGVLTGTFEYNTDLFDATTIARLIGHFQTLLVGLVATPERRLSELPLLTAAERLLLGTWCATQVDVALDRGLPYLFEAQVERTPEAVAVVGPEVRYTYQELNRRANQVAHYLRSLGVGPEVRVGLCMERSAAMVVGLLGILKAGGAYVPLDPVYPQERLRGMVANAQPLVVLTQTSVHQAWDEANETPGAPWLLEQGTQVVCLDTDWTTIAQASAANPCSRVDAANLAYVIYTSGSTGIPKGVQISHGALTNFLHAMSQQLQLTEQACFLAVTTLSFDIAALELFLPLTVGARVVVASRAEVTDGQQLSQKLTDSGATIMQATPATWRLLVATGWQGTPQLKMLCGGSALPRDLAEQLLPKGACLWNLYGPTETTIWATVQQMATGQGSPPIGRPIANTQSYLLDSQMQPVPVGVPGDLYIGGHGLARGYLHRPALTAEVFVPHPFSAEPGARLYKTGDLARYRPDGTIVFLGRDDHQVKIRGFRIELGEIEITLGQHPAIQEAVVMAYEGAHGVTAEPFGTDERLVAYIVPQQGHSPTVSALRDFLRQKLPHYMVPSTFVMLETLPLTPNGKIDRRALPAPEPVRPELAASFVTPRTPVEAVLADIWAEVLGLEQVGVNDNFFELGGHSLLAAQVVSRVRDVLQVEMPLILLFATPTVATLASAMLQDPTEGAKVEKVAHMLACVAALSDDEVDTLLRESDRGQLPT